MNASDRKFQVRTLLSLSLVIALFALWASQINGDEGVGIFFVIVSGLQGISAMAIIIKDCNRMIIAEEMANKEQ